MAEVILLRQQLLVLNRGNSRCPPLSSADRFVMGICTFLGPKGPSRDLIKLVVEMKERNLDYGCPKIAALITNVTGHEIDAESVRRILKKHFRPMPGRGPSWLMPIGSHTNKLWYVDLFRMDSAFLKTYWVMVVMDSFTRRKMAKVSVIRQRPLFAYWRWRVP